MGKCTNFDESTGLQCTQEAVKQGLCQAHYLAVQAAKQPASPKAIEKTLPELKKCFGAVGKGTGDGTGGQFLGGAKNQPHVHKYGGNGAHVKVGNEEYRFLRPDAKGSFDEAMWDQGISAVKLRKLANASTLHAAMSMTLCNYSGLGEAELIAQLSKLG